MLLRTVSNNKHFPSFPACGRVQWDTKVISILGFPTFVACINSNTTLTLFTLRFASLVYYIFSQFPLIYPVSVYSKDCICYVQAVVRMYDYRYTYWYCILILYTVQCVYHTYSDSKTICAYCHGVRYRGVQGVLGPPSF